MLARPKRRRAEARAEVVSTQAQVLAAVEGQHIQDRQALLYAAGPDCARTTELERGAQGPTMIVFLGLLACLLGFSWKREGGGF